MIGHHTSAEAAGPETGGNFKRNRRPIRWHGPLFWFTHVPNSAAFTKVFGIILCRLADKIKIVRQGKIKIEGKLSFQNLLFLERNSDKNSSGAYPLPDLNRLTE